MASSHEAHNPRQNVLLANLSAPRLEELGPHLHWQDLVVEQVIYEPNARIEYAYFPTTGMISVVSLMEDGRSIEVGTIGSEGMLGTPLLVAPHAPPFRYFVQIPGHCYRIAVGRLREAAVEHHDVRDVIERYDAAYLTQTMQGVACNGLHAVQQRCCRWLLLARDRSESDELQLTHEFLALMLGVRRASVSEVLGPLQEAGLVRSHRGLITILDRAGLEAGACECYQVMLSHHRRLLG
jgi:CRP-like cAMP-binding protein